MAPRPTPTLILLPGGLCVSGVALWGVRLASALAERGGHVTLALLAHPSARARLDLTIDPRVRRLDLSGLPPIERCEGDLSPYLPVLRDESLRLAQFGSVAVLPSQHGDCFALAAALASVIGDRVRLIGTAHSDNAYDLRLLTHYESALAHLVVVSDTLEAKAREALPARGEDITQIPYGVPIPAHMPVRDEAHGRPLRLLYAGRFEHRQKRIMALPMLSEMLTQAGVTHEMTLVGEGPARQKLGEACEGHAQIRLLAAQSQTQLARFYDSHDAMILPSRYEGLSVAMLEAMAHACVPIVTRCDSGSGQAITHEHTGLIAEASPDDDERAAATALCASVRRFLELDRAELAANAAARAQERYSIDRHADRWCDVLQRAARSPARWWPATRPAAFTGVEGTQSGSVPPGAAGRLRRTLESLAGRAILIHGAGRHTIELAPLLASADVRAIVDDDPARFGERLLGWKIIGPHEAALTGATDVIISSAMHEEAIWGRRNIYEEQGLTVHRLTQAAEVEAKPASHAAAMNP